jgi:hypothetical protein
VDATKQNSVTLNMEALSSSEASKEIRSTARCEKPKESLHMPTYDETPKECKWPLYRFCTQKDEQDAQNILKYDIYPCQNKNSSLATA